jgi:hypothetical protein
MEPGFRVRLWCVIRPRRTLIRGSGRVGVTNRKSTKTRTLTVQRSYEPNRIALACEIEAYERVVPPLRRPFRTNQPSNQAPRLHTKQRRGGI